MSDVEAAAFSKPGQKITIQYGATPANVEKVTPTKQTWARSAAYVIGFIVIVVGATLMYRHYVDVPPSVKTAAPAPPVYTGGGSPPHPPATGNIMEDIANGVTNLPFGNPTLEEMENKRIKVDTGFVDENGTPVYADGEGHVDDHSMTKADEPVR